MRASSLVALSLACVPAGCGLDAGGADYWDPIEASGVEDGGAVDSVPTTLDDRPADADAGSTLPDAAPDAAEAAVPPPDATAPEDSSADAPSDGQHEGPGLDVAVPDAGALDAPSDASGDAAARDAPLDVEREAGVCDPVSTCSAREQEECAAACWGMTPLHCVCEPGHCWCL